MKRFCIAICDDEKEICLQVESYLEKYLQENKFEYEIDVFSNGKSLCQAMNETEYDIVFLDIEMPDMTGISIGHYIREELHNEIVQIAYISAKQEYAMELFEYRPINFLVKPLNYQGIVKIMEKYLVITKYDNDLFAYKKGHEFHKVKISEILYFENYKRKVTITTMQGIDTFYESMDTIYSRVKNKKFLFIHKSVIVNYNYIKEFGANAVTMTDNKNFPISQSRRAAIKEMHMKLMLEEA